MRNDQPNPWTFGLLTVIAFLCLALGLTFLMTPKARAQGVQCGPANEVEAALRDQHGESPAWVGQSPGGPLVLTLSEKGTWTIYLRKDGMACLLSSGKNGQLVDLPKPGERS